MVKGKGSLKGTYQLRLAPEDVAMLEALRKKLNAIDYSTLIVAIIRSAYQTNVVAQEVKEQ